LRRQLIAALALTIFVVPAAAETAPAKSKAPKLSVMTRNIYLGADIARPIGSKTIEEFEQKNQIVWDTVKKNNFGARAPWRDRPRSRASRPRRWASIQRTGRRQACGRPIMAAGLVRSG